MKTFSTKAIAFFSIFLISICTFAQVQIDSIIITNETCSGDCDGTLTIFTSGGTAPLLFDIGGTPQASNVFTGLCATTYNVTVNDALPSTDATTATITSPSPLIFTISTVDASAYGLCDGTADVTISGGTPPYAITYYASDGTTIIQIGTITIVDSLCAATYYVKVTDANSCPPNGSGSPGLTAFAIAQPAPPPLAVGQNTVYPTCYTICNGYSWLEVYGGVPPYTFSWGTNSITGICPTGTIPAWTVTDAIGQQQSGPAVISNWAIFLPIAVINSNESCVGLCDGKITANINFSGGGNGGPTGPYTYSIDGTTWQSSSIFTGLCPGNYNLYLQDANLCPGVTSNNFTILPATPLTYTLSTNNCSAYGVCNGSANVTINGGTPPYVITYYASNGTTVLQTGTSTSKSGLCAGTYYVKVTDSKNCSSTGPSGNGLNMFTISQPPALVVNQALQMPHCYPNCDGNTQLIVSGGVPPYTYSWGSWDLGGFCDGDNAPAWTVTDSIGQQVSGPAQGMWANQPLCSPIVNSHETCIGACDGEMEITITGGDPPYSFTIDNGVTNQSNLLFNNLCPSTYTLYYTDSYGCGGWVPFTINAASPIVVTIDTIINAPCIGGCNGSATLNVSGGTPPYSFSWNDIFNQTAPTAINLCAGIYTCTVTDDNGCDTTINVTINEPLGDTLTATWNTTPESCFGTCDGSAMVTANGGVPPYTFQWDDPCLTTTDSSACASCQGVYNCIVTDSNGCSITVSGITVGGPTAPLAVTPTVINVSCFGLCDGSITPVVTGGTPPYIYLWSTGCTAPSCGPLCASSYELVIIDSMGCTLTDTVILSEPFPLIATAVFVSNPTSIGACDGVANGSVTGGVTPYSFLWNGCTPTILSSTIITPNINILCDGEYQFMVEDMNGCIDSSDCITITDPPTNINESTNNINNIYPNPTSGLINIEFSDKVILPLTIELIDVKGKIVKDFSITNKNSVIDLTSLPIGVYVLTNTKLSINKTIILE